MGLASLDGKLKRLAASLNGKLTKNEDKGMHVPSNFETRSVDWQIDDLKYSIQIFPIFKNKYIRKWGFSACCTYDTDKSSYLKCKTILESKNQSQVLAQFDNCISEALEFLKNLTKKDLEHVCDFED